MFHGTIRNCQVTVHKWNNTWDIEASQNINMTSICNIHLRNTDEVWQAMYETLWDIQTNKWHISIGVRSDNGGYEVESHAATTALQNRKGMSLGFLIKILLLYRWIFASQVIHISFRPVSLRISLVCGNSITKHLLVYRRMYFKNIFWNYIYMAASKQLYPVFTIKSLKKRISHTVLWQI